mmetsp:Transcript_108971/g.307114  ORF Transcript_108971/g.307114 Transcript_108971/m.307114 type:complete len:293 (+) Transcript_108971:52-930(+)
MRRHRTHVAIGSLRRWHGVGAALLALLLLLPTVLICVCCQRRATARFWTQRSFVAPRRCHEAVATPDDQVSGEVVRIVAMSDTHGFHSDLTVPDGDVLVHCGDAASNSHWSKRRHTDFAKFARWFKKFRHPTKFFIAGNHEDGVHAASSLGDHVLVGSRQAFGLHFYGLPFGRRRQALLPEGIDVLLSHEPPWGVLDLALRDADSPPELARPIGSPALLSGLAAMRDGSPRLHVFGHVHEGRGRRLVNGTVFVNAATANRGSAKFLEHGCWVIDVRVPGPGVRAIVDSIHEH